MRADEHSPWGETEIRELFARRPEDLATHHAALTERIIAGATARRRRSSTLAAGGAVAATLALVAAVFVLGPLATPRASVVTPAAPLAVTSAAAAQSPTIPAASPVGESPTAPAGTTAPGIDLASLLGSIPELTGLGRGEVGQWSFTPSVAPFGAEPVAGLLNCDAQLASPTGVQPLVVARGGASPRDSLHPSVDLIIAKWAPGQASTAITQVADHSGGCALVESHATLAIWPGHDGLLLRDVSGGYQRAGALQRVGDVTIGVTVVDLDPDHALAQAMAIGDAMASKARAAGTGKG